MAFMLDYYYGSEGNQFAFYRVPKILFQNVLYKGLSADAKILYGIMLDRVTLSAQNGWKDRENRVYIFFTVDEVMEQLSCGNKKAIQLMDELEKKAGLIERKRQGQGKPNIIYVKNFIRMVDKSGERHFLECQNDTSGSAESTSQEVSKSHSNNTDNNETDNTDTDRSIHPDQDGIDTHRRYEAWFRKALEIEYLLPDYPYKEEMLDGILDLLVETCCTNRDTIRIAGDDRPADVVRSRLMKLNSSHIRYVMDTMRSNTADVRNIKQYLLTALYNAPATMSAYYQSKVNHDMYGSREGEEVNAGQSFDYGYY